jgi:thiamine biosynthesis lipoprotein
MNEREIATTTFKALGTIASVCTTRRGAIEQAGAILRSELAEIDLACSRFRVDSEIAFVTRNGGRPVVISPLLAELVGIAIDAADHTDGAVDPTVGASIIGLGYTDDFDELAGRADSSSSGVRPAPGWRCIELDRKARVLRVPAGVVVDLGATAKAFAADRACARIAAATESEVLVNLGGDLAVSGSPEGGWAVGLALDCATPPSRTAAVVSVHQGGLASSGTTVRTWRSGGRTVHHIVDPSTGDSSITCWQLVTVAAATCLDANVASTAAIVWGARACERLTEMGLPSRLVHNDGSVLAINGWPEDQSRGFRDVVN